ncbi:hypothetical protein U1Q18_048971, partial [Sarracenia purpurea var. burkii]
ARTTIVRRNRRRTQTNRRSSRSETLVELGVEGGIRLRRSDPEDQFASAPIRLRGSVVPAVKLWRVAIGVSFHPLAFVSRLGFSGLQSLVADRWVRSGYRSPIMGGGVLTWLCLSVSSPFFTAFLMVEEINFTLSDGATGGVFDFEEFLRCAVCLSQIPKNSISVLRLSRVALEIGGRSGILRNGAAPLAAVAFADDCGLSVEKIRALSRPSL